MPVTELSSAYVTPYDPRRRAAERRPPREPLARAPVEIQIVPMTPEPALLTPMFRPDLSQLAVVAEASPLPAPPFDDALDKLVSAVREGDLPRARAAFEALETEMLVERSAARPEPAPSPYGAAPPASHAADAAYEMLSHYLDEDGHV